MTTRRNRWSWVSNERLGTCDPRLILLFGEVLQIHDCSILCGARNEAEQTAAFEGPFSRTPWPFSKHNHFKGTIPCSLAVDVMPYFGRPIVAADWENREAFIHFGGIVKGVAGCLGIPIRCGHDWDGDNDLDDQTFMDLVHYELITGA